MPLGRSTLSLIQNGFSGSSASRTQVPHKIGYPDGWKTGETHEWYQSQPSTTFKYLQYRKERESPFYAEYIVAELDNDTVCRFDRRGDLNTRANAFTVEGITAEDTAHVIDKKKGIDLKDDPDYKVITDKSDLLLRVHFPKGQDLLTILGICHSIQNDTDARAFNLTKFNCYFLSWMIITATARRTMDWALLGEEAHRWEDLVKTTIEGLSVVSDPDACFETPTRSTLGLRRKGDKHIRPNADAIRFIGSSYLISTLRQALINTRTDIQKSLGEQIFGSTVEPAIRRISKIASTEAAQKAARSHAGQAARDIAMKQFIELAWRTILSENGGQLWENQCKVTENSVWWAADAAADADMDTEMQAGSMKEEKGAQAWELAWDKAWEVGWNSNLLKGKERSTSTNDGSLKLDISSHAKKAWRKAWIEAYQANNQYIPLVVDGIATYVNKSLPKSSSEVLRIDMRVRHTSLTYCITLANRHIPIVGSIQVSCSAPISRVRND